MRLRAACGRYGGRAASPFKQGLPADRCTGASAMAQASLGTVIAHLRAHPGEVLICVPIYLAGKVLAEHG